MVPRLNRCVWMVKGRSFSIGNSWWTEECAFATISWCFCLILGGPLLEVTGLWLLLTSACYLLVPGGDFFEDGCINKEMPIEDDGFLPCLKHRHKRFTTTFSHQLPGLSRQVQSQASKLQSKYLTVCHFDIVLNPNWIIF